MNKNHAVQFKALPKTDRHESSLKMHYTAITCLEELDVEFSLEEKSFIVTYGKSGLIDMKAAWLTDIHLNFLKKINLRRFLNAYQKNQQIVFLLLVIQVRQIVLFPFFNELSWL